jgi:hypothetical protein
MLTRHSSFKLMQISVSLWYKRLWLGVRCSLLCPCRRKHVSAAVAVCGKSSAARADAKTAAAAAQAESKLLVQAAQQLLEDAQEDAQQVSRNLKSATAALVPANRAAERAAAAPAGGACMRRSTSATAAAAATVDDLRSSPLGTVLAQYKEAQAVWAQEKVCHLSRITCVPADLTVAFLPAQQLWSTWRGAAWRCWCCSASSSVTCVPGQHALLLAWTHCEAVG